MAPVTTITPPHEGQWFEHALAWEPDPEHGDRPARCMVVHSAAGGHDTAIPQVCYRRVDDYSGHRPSSVDIDLFDQIVRRWLSPEETELAEQQARFRHSPPFPDGLPY